MDYHRGTRGPAAARRLGGSSRVGKTTWTLHCRRDEGSPAKRGGTISKVASSPAHGMSAVVYDAAILVAADRNERRTWAEHKARLEMGAVPLVPSPVVAQVSRSPRQAQLRRFLTGCEVVPFGENDAHETGRLLSGTRTSDIVDAAVVTVAVRRRCIILTGDPQEIERLVRASRSEVAVVAV
jgi:hypothetical protein